MAPLLLYVVLHSFCRLTALAAQEANSSDGAYLIQRSKLANNLRGSSHAKKGDAVLPVSLTEPPLAPQAFFSDAQRVVVSLYAGYNCYNNSEYGYHGGEPMDVHDTPSSGNKASECQADCAATPNCVGFVFQPKDPDCIWISCSGSCWFRKEINLDMCQLYDGNNFYTYTVEQTLPPAPPTPTPPVGTWKVHDGWNCYANIEYGYIGGKPVDQNDTPIPSQSLDDCKLKCMANPNCVAFVRKHRRHSTAQDCYLRMAINLDQCQRDRKWVTYENDRKHSFEWIAEIEKSGGTHVLPAGTFFIDRQYVLPEGTTLEGAGPGKTIIQAVYSGNKFQGPGEELKLCGANHKNRIGIIVGNDTYVGKFSFIGSDYTRGDSSLPSLCGGGAIETPGCATAYCQEPKINTGVGDGNGVSNVVIEDIDFPAKQQQLMLYMPQTAKGKKVSSNITVRNLRSSGTLADGLNIHGAHKDVLVESCVCQNPDDDCFAVWDSNVIGDYAHNITFKNNYAIVKQSDSVDCFAQYGGRSVNYINNSCAFTNNAMIHFHSNYCGPNPYYYQGYGDSGLPKGKPECYPQDSSSLVSGNRLMISGPPEVYRENGSLPRLEFPI